MSLSGGTDDDEDEMESSSLLSGGRPARTRFELKGVVSFGIATAVVDAPEIWPGGGEAPEIWPGGGETVVACAAAALSAAFSATYISKWFEGGGRIPGIGRSCEDKDVDNVGFGDDIVKAPGRMSVAN